MTTKELIKFIGKENSEPAYFDENSIRSFKSLLERLEAHGVKFNLRVVGHITFGVFTREYIKNFDDSQIFYLDYCEEAGQIWSSEANLVDSMLDRAILSVFEHE